MRGSDSATTVRAALDRVTDARLEITLGIGLMVGAAAIAVTLSQSPVTLALVNTAEHAPIGTTYQPTAACQSDETLPRGTSAIRLRVEAYFGPRVAVTVLARGRAIAHGGRGAGWSGGAVTVPVSPLSATRVGVDLCFKLFVRHGEPAALMGEPVSGTLAARGPEGVLPGRLRVEYLRPGTSSWWALAPAVARRMGLGRAWPGAWNALLVLSLMGCVVLVCSRLLLRGFR
ncbi:MAG TPA: hypothetical protein VK778_11275 [Solirubrobacteraceae bacterium]|jgi:hypothetical protein|nr:hypothetical protein [Solirubrobacteraceae bacterium]